MSYKITIEVLGVEITKKGKTSLEALDKFDMTWEDLKGKGVLKAEKGEKKMEKLMNATQLRRMFSNKVSKQTWAKNLELILN